MAETMIGAVLLEKLAASGTGEAKIKQVLSTCGVPAKRITVAQVIGTLRQLGHTGTVAKAIELSGFVDMAGQLMGNPLETTVANLKSELAGSKTEVVALRSERDHLTERMEAATKQIKALEDQLEALKAAPKK